MDAASKRVFKHEIAIKTDGYSVKSKDYLRFLLYNLVKSTFVGSLRTIETRLGRTFPAFDGIRSEILRIGNDSIRELHNILDRFNVEQVPDVIEFRPLGTVPINGKGKEEVDNG